MDATGTTTYFTSLRDSVWWSIKLFVILMVAIALVSGLSGRVTKLPSLLSLAKGSVAVLLFSVFLGLLLFCFGWMGRVTLSESGIEAPRYSGIRSFLTWHQIDSVTRGSLSGWPCTIITGGQPREALYLMVIGETKRRMVESIRRHAGANNLLAAYFDQHGASNPRATTSARQRDS